jgi:hypothetical protein
MKANLLSRFGMLVWQPPMTLRAAETPHPDNFQIYANAYAENETHGPDPKPDRRSKPTYLKLAPHQPKADDSWNKIKTIYGQITLPEPLYFA